MFDYHTHTNYSSDCPVAMKLMVQSAIDKGLAEIAFTDHIDPDYGGSDIFFDFDLALHQKEIELLKNQYGERIQLVKGLELGIQVHILNECSELVKRHRPDFVIASMHMSKRRDLYNGSFFEAYDSVEAVYVFFEELLEMTKQYHDYNVIGHLDLLKRYSSPIRDLPDVIFQQAAEPALKQIIRSQRGIEVNTSGLRQGLGETLPGSALLELYYELGGDILTIGSDAHRPEDIGHSWKEALALVKKIGFKQICTFRDMRPIYHKI